MRVETLKLGPMETNCYIVSNEETLDAFIIDPGYDGRSIAKETADQGLKLQAILLTHGHFDHIMGIVELTENKKIPLYIYKDEAPLLSDSKMNCSSMLRRDYIINADRLLEDNEEFKCAGISIKLIATPGHTRGSACYYIESGKALFSGDTLFMESIGRTDLPTGNSHLIIESIRDRLLILPDETKVYPGHGPSTTLGYEKSNNSYIYGQNYFD